MLGTSSFDAVSGIVSFAPSAALDWSKDYVATVTADGLPATGAAWTFSTSAAPGLIDSLAGLLGGLLPLGGGTAGAQVGERFTVSTPGTATGIRVFAGSDTGSTHTGYLRKSDGTVLSQVALVADTVAGANGPVASGWMTGTLSQAVPLVVGQEYLVTVGSGSGRYAIAVNGLSAATTNGFISTPPSGGALWRGQGYPVSTSPNDYWVDVLFSRQQ